MALPAALLRAVAAQGGGKIALVVGAGCSLEEPTGIPLAGTCSQEAHDRLVADGVIKDGDCEQPSNLSMLADVVNAKTGSQRALVDQLSQSYPLKSPSPNTGHKIAAALLSEGAVNAVLTLNFDLALSVAIGEIGVATMVGLIDGPADFANQKTVNVFYLHRNANEVNAEAWVLRTSALEAEWKTGWEAIVAAKLIASPVVVFAGLGSPADVLVESSTRIRKAIPGGSHAFQVDPGEFNASPFAKALGIEADHFIKLGWSDFMEQLSERLVIEQVGGVKREADKLIRQNGLPPEELQPLLDRLQSIGLLEMGKLRAAWSLYPKLYRPDGDLIRTLFADVLLAVAFVSRSLGCSAVVNGNGIVDLKRDGQPLASLVFVSGGGSKNASAVEAGLAVKMKQLKALPTMPVMAVATAVTASFAETPPPDVLRDDQSESILFGGTQLKVFACDAFRADPSLAERLI